MVLRAFLRDPLKRVDATEPHFQLVTAELLDRLAEALGDAPLPVRFGLREMPHQRNAGDRQPATSVRIGANALYCALWMWVLRLK